MTAVLGLNYLKCISTFLLNLNFLYRLKSNMFRCVVLDVCVNIYWMDPEPSLNSVSFPTFLYDLLMSLSGSGYQWISQAHWSCPEDARNNISNRNYPILGFQQMFEDRFRPQTVEALILRDLDGCFSCAWVVEYAWGSQHVGYLLSCQVLHLFRVFCFFIKGVVDFMIALF